MSDENLEPVKYMTYKGMGHTPMIGGVPMFYALGLLGGVILLMALLVAGLKVFSGILFLIILSSYFVVKVACENNNKAPETIKLTLFGIFAKIKYGKVIKIDTGVKSKNEERAKFYSGFSRLLRNK